MTPLAKRVAEISATEREYWKRNGFDKLLAPFPDGVKCFEMTQVYELIGALASDAQKRNNLAEAVAFLPAPATWIEYREPQHLQNLRPKRDSLPAIKGYFLVQKDANHASCVEITGVWIHGGFAFVPLPMADLPLLANVDPDGWALDSTLQQQQLLNIGEMRVDGSNVDWDQTLIAQQLHAYFLYSALSLINSPRVVNRTERQKSNKLEKFLERKNRKPYELLPWHEIFLDIAPPKEASDADEDAPTRLTGPKALHWCRQFLRIRLGKLERVRGHFRGDAAAGVVQSRYTVGIKPRC